jgi:hypothetical protein
MAGKSSWLRWHRPSMQVGVYTAAGLLIAGCAGDKADDLGQTRQSLTGTHKYCSFAQQDNWRDTLIVPDGWTVDTCMSWGNAICGGPLCIVEVGCISETSFTPGTSCGWSSTTSGSPDGEESVAPDDGQIAATSAQSVPDLASSASDDDLALQEDRDGIDEESSLGDGVLLGTARLALTGAHKLCTVFISGNWRDTILVSNGWTRERCLTDWRQHVGASQARLGCITNGSFSFASTSGTPPPDNSCGW